MAYNNGFPMSYQPMYYQPQYQQVQNPVQNASQNTNSGIIWVQGEAGAKSYLVAPNTTVQLWDSEDQVIYLKSADASGMPSMRVLDYTIRQSNQPTMPQNLSQRDERYVTKEELREFQDALEKRFKALSEEDGVKNE